MSSATSTPHAVASEARPVRLALWRALQAQPVAATRAVLDPLGAQEIRESILEAYRPPRPAVSGRLDDPLDTPFRDAPPAPGSRLRGAADPGVGYGAEAIRTGCAELGCWRSRFPRVSHGLTRRRAAHAR
jgi:hypothetical protein